MATKPLTTDHVTVATASIEVKVIRIGARQMTQTVFRQLPRRKIWDEDMVALLGVPWGCINHFWPGWVEYLQCADNSQFAPWMISPVFAERRVAVHHVRAA